MRGEMDTYLDAVGNQIRWKAARKLVRQELQGHIEEKKQEAGAKGYSTEEAEHKAVEAMGDPVETGRKLDRLHRPKMDIWMLTSIAVLAAFGIWLVLERMGATALPFAVLERISNVRYEWLIFRIIALLLGAACIVFDIRGLLNKRIHLIAIGYAGIAGMIAHNLSSSYWGYWQGYWFTFISYLSLMLLLVATAGWMTKIRGKGWIGLFIAVIVFLGVAALNLSRENSQSLVILCFLLAAITMIWLSKTRMLWKIIASAAIAAFLAVYFGESVLSVLTNPSGYDRMGSDTIDSILARLQSVQLLGRTPGFIVDSLAYHNIILYIAVQFGLIPAAVLLGALGIFIWRLLRACLRIQDRLGRILATGMMTFLTALITANLLLNAFFISLAGNYLPFLSFSGPEAALAAIIPGVLLGLYRRRDLYPAREPDGTENKSILFG